MNRNSETIDKAKEFLSLEITNRESLISELKKRLIQSNDKTFEYLDGWISEEEYAEIKAERRNIRDMIYELESEE